MENNKLPKISIIIVNRNGRRDTIECLESLFRSNYKNYEVILVDNASSNDSIDQIKSRLNGNLIIDSKYFESTGCTHVLLIEEYLKKRTQDLYHFNGYFNPHGLSIAGSKKLILLRNSTNEGFAGGNNSAIRMVLEGKSSDFILLLNNDTVVEENYLTEIIDRFKRSVEYNKVALFGGTIFSYYKNRHQIKIYSKYNKDTYVSQLSGAGIFLNCNLIEKLGLLDENLFMYCEDSDICYRAMNLGYKNLYISTGAKIYHKIEGSSIGFNKNKILFQMRNSVIIYHKNKSYSFIVFICDILKSSVGFTMKYGLKGLRYSFMGIRNGIKYLYDNRG